MRNRKNTSGAGGREVRKAVVRDFDKRSKKEIWPGQEFGFSFLCRGTSLENLVKGEM